MPDKKQVIGIYGEMTLAMELHERGWSVYRAYIDSNIDFVITKYWCNDCNNFTTPQRKPKKNGEMITDRCQQCAKKEIRLVEKYIQVKTSEGEQHGKTMSYSFHAKLRHNIDIRSYYVWIAVVEKEQAKIPHYYIFHHTKVNRFDDLSLPSYQETDNQKTTLRIDDDGNVLNKGRKHDYSCFKEFHNNFKKLEEFIPLNQR